MESPTTVMSPGTEERIYGFCGGSTGETMDSTAPSMSTNIEGYMQDAPCMSASTEGYTQHERRRPDLPSDKADLEKLVRWFYRRDAEWMADALWLRYTKVARSMYRNKGRYRFGFQGRIWKNGMLALKSPDQPPMSYNILPTTQPFDVVDRLSALSEDIRLEVLSCLMFPDVLSPQIGRHPLNSVALVSRAWRAQVDAFCSHALLVWKQRVKKPERSSLS